MKHKIKASFEWVKLYQKTTNAVLVCRRCGIIQTYLEKVVSTFSKKRRRWFNELVRRPHNTPKRKIFEKETNWISEL